MKKLLIATTALVGTASVAAADITFSGYGRWGIIYEEDRASGGTDLEETRLESRYRLNIDSSTETDGGIRFAARIRVQADDNNDGSVDAGSFGGARFQANVGGLRVRVGNVSGVHDAAEVIDFFGYEPGLVGQVGQYSTFGAAFIDAFVSSSAGGAEGNGGANGVNIKYEYGDFAVMASYSEDIDENDGYSTSSASCGANTAVLPALPSGTITVDGSITDPSSCDDDFEAWEIGASYTFSGWTIGAAYASAESDGFDHEYYSATVSGTIGIADVSFFIGDTDGVTDDDVAYGLSGSVPVGAATNIVASYAGGGADGLEDAFGIGFTHSLGGGVSLSGMVGRNEGDNTVADLGVRFNF